MRKVFTEAELQNIDDLEKLADIIYAFGIEKNSFVDYVEHAISKINDITIDGFEVFTIINKIKDYKSFKTLYHAVVTIDIDGKKYSFGYNNNEHRLSFKAGDRGIRYYELSSSRDNEMEILADIIAVIKKVAKV